MIIHCNYEVMKINDYMSCLEWKKFDHFFMDRHQCQTSGRNYCAFLQISVYNELFSSNWWIDIEWKKFNIWNKNMYMSIYFNAYQFKKFNKRAKFVFIFQYQWPWAQWPLITLKKKLKGYLLTYHILKTSSNKQRLHVQISKNLFLAPMTLTEVLSMPKLMFLPKFLSP
jgi:hypothetical protein